MNKIKFIRAMKLLESKEFENFVSQFENTNERPFNKNLQDIIESKGLNPDDVFDKCFVVYDSFCEKFIYQSIHRYYTTPEFKTFNVKDIEKIIKWLNSRLEKLSLDELLLEEY